MCLKFCHPLPITLPELGCQPILLEGSILSEVLWKVSDSPVPLYEYQRRSPFCSTAKIHSRVSGCPGNSDVPATVSGRAPCGLTNMWRRFSHPVPITLPEFGSQPRGGMITSPVCGSGSSPWSLYWYQRRLPCGSTAMMTPSPHPKTCFICSKPGLMGLPELRTQFCALAGSPICSPEPLYWYHRRLPFVVTT